jgi:hypothetical protein
MSIKKITAEWQKKLTEIKASVLDIRQGQPYALCHPTITCPCYYLLHSFIQRTWLQLNRLGFARQEICIYINLLKTKGYDHQK